MALARINKSICFAIEWDYVRLDSVHQYDIVAAVMWIFLNLLILLAVDLNWTQVLHVGPCTDTAYMDCHHYCKSNCLDRGSECVYHCENGCGCTESQVARNNGGCYQLMNCLFDDNTEEESNPKPIPCNQTARIFQNEILN